MRETDHFSKGNVEICSYHVFCGEGKSKKDVLRHMFDHISLHSEGIMIFQGGCYGD